jgi:ABC-type sugar transport system substrate-binding protein
VVGKRTLAVMLPHEETNKYQQLIVGDARKAAQKAGYEIDSYFARGSVIAQVRQVYECIHGQASARTRAIIAMPVTDNSLNRAATDAIRAGIGWICLHREMDCLLSLRQEFPTIPISTLGPDQREIGRIQGRQFRLLLPEGGRVLYVQGNATTSSARSRLEGMREAISGSKVEAKDVLDGNWSTDGAERTVSGWLRMVMSGKTHLDLAGCQNDEMAVGARRALHAVSSYLGRPDLEDVSVTGCNGLADLGQRLVNEGKIDATIIVPSTGAIAVEMLVDGYAGKPLPQSTTVPSVSYPDEESLARRRKR